MNYEIAISDIKGKEQVTMKVWPSNNVEIAFFQHLFSGEVIVEREANKDIVIIKPLKDATIPAIEDHEFKTKFTGEPAIVTKRHDSTGDGSQRSSDPASGRK